MSDKPVPAPLSNPPESDSAQTTEDFTLKSRGHEEIAGIYAQTGKLGEIMAKEGPEVDQLLFPRNWFHEEFERRGVTKPTVLSLGSGTGRYLYPIEGIKDEDITQYGIDLNPNLHPDHRMAKVTKGNLLVPAARYIEQGAVPAEVDAAEMTFVIRYINEVPLEVLEDQNAKALMSETIQAYGRLIERKRTPQAATTREQIPQILEALATLQSSAELAPDTRAQLEKLTKDPAIAKAYVMLNWLSTVRDDGFLAVTYTTEPHPLRQATVTDPIMLKELGVMEMAEHKPISGGVLKDVRRAVSSLARGGKEIRSALDFYNALQSEETVALHVEHDFYNDLGRMDNALAIVALASPGIHIERAELRVARTMHTLLRKPPRAS